jgi:hypothetical protein
MESVYGYPSEGASDKLTRLLGVREIVDKGRRSFGGDHEATADLNNDPDTAAHVLSAHYVLQSTVLWSTARERKPERF